MKKIIFALLLCFCSNSFAQNIDNNEAVRKYIDNFGNKIISIAANKKITSEQRKDRIIDEIDKTIDSSWISRFVLGKNYRNFSDPQKERFKELYRQFMINTYAPKFKDYNGKKFTVLSVEKQKIFYVARCEFLPHDSNTPISFDFRVRAKNNKLLVLDFVAEGVSLIETQRSEFDSAISKNGISKFIEDMENRVLELKRKK
jgi:phospholipid transport system substrate-binding protein